jgi:hypothetical protein
MQYAFATQAQSVPGFDGYVGRLRREPTEGQKARPGAECRSRTPKGPEHFMQESGTAETDTMQASQRRPKPIPKRCRAQAKPAPPDFLRTFKESKRGPCCVTQAQGVSEQEDDIFRKAGPTEVPTKLSAPSFKHKKSGYSEERLH